MAKRKTNKNYYVSWKQKTRLGETKGRKEFSTFQSACAFAVRVNNQKSATLGSWGGIRRKKILK